MIAVSPPERVRLRLTLAYDGGQFLGAQRQARGRTVVGDVEAALGALVRHDVRLTLAGRTDRGVHALGQVAHADVSTEMALPALQRATNALLAPDVVVTDLRAAERTFHARYDARWREYRYRVWHAPVRSPRHAKTSWHWSGTLDHGALVSGADAMLGEHDFLSFASGVGGAVDGRWPRGTVRTVYGSCWGRLAGDSIEHGTILEYRVRASGFLPRMARTMVRALVLVGSRQRPPAWISELLQARDRRLGPSPAPPQGLTLAQVGYELGTDSAPWQRGFGIGYDVPRGAAQFA